MIDFESFSTGKLPVICQVGACYFDLGTGETGRELKLNIDAATSLKAGASMEMSSVYWWLGQSDQARASILADPKLDIVEAMILLNDFLSDADQIWSHATFDFVLLTETLKLLEIKPNFNFRAARDIRTLVSLSKVSVRLIPRDGVHHDALDDCKYQAKYVSAAHNAIYRRMGGPKLV
jgi:hypothetical protein